jgi:hypothetical protein
MWSAIEVNTGIICACVPSMKPLAARLLPRMIKDVSESDVGFNSQLDVPNQTQPRISVSNEEEWDPNASQRSTNATAEPWTAWERTINALDEETPVTMTDFLAAPATNAQRDRLPSATSGASYVTESDNADFFDFVNIKTPKNMLKMSNRESIFPNALATILFFLWGFAYGLLASLNLQFESIVKTSKVESLGLRGAYFGAYLVGSTLVGRPVLKRWGFKGCFVSGLFIYGCGTLVFWPSAVLFSYVAFLISNFIVGFGLSVLETAANPFIALCGPMENAEVRLNISQGFQAIGGVVSPLLASKVFFKNTNDAESLIGVQWAYLGIAFFDVLLAVAFYYLPIPEASDANFKELADRRRNDNYAKVFGIPVVWLTLGLGVFAQFTYVGGQEVFYINFRQLVKAVKPE